MELKAPEMAPKIPNGVGKISVEAVDIIDGADFVAELGLAEELSVQRPTESRDFAQVGQILREMLPLEAQIEETIVPPPSIDAELPIETPVVKAGRSEARQQLFALETAARARILPAEVADNAVSNVEITPLESVANSQLLRPVPIPALTENASTSKAPFEVKLSGDPQVPVRPDGQIVEKRLNRKFPPAQPEIITPRSVASIPADISIVKPSESKLQITAETPFNVDSFGLGISDKPQTPRSLQAAIAATQANPNRPQSAEAKVIFQISTAISNSSKDTVEIRLDPPELGRVIISITQNDSGLSATVTSEKAEISDLLRRHAELLSRELSKSGFSDASLEFSHRDQQQDQPIFEREEVRFSSAAPEQTDAESAIEMILQSQSGSLDIRL